MTAVTECVLKLCTKMSVIDYHIMESRRGKPLKVPDDKRFATDFEQRFWCVVGQGTHAFASSGREDHGLHGVTP